jgi:hypothetical protein
MRQVGIAGIYLSPRTRLSTVPPERALVVREMLLVLGMQCRLEEISADWTIVLPLVRKLETSIDPAALQARGI